MKKLTLLALFLAITQSLFAQSVNFGIKGGLNESYVDRGQLIVGNKGYFRPGFHAGAFVDFGFNKWSIQPSLLYTVKGFKGTTDFVQNTPGGPVNASIIGTRTFNYLEMPVNVLYNIKIKPGKIFVGGGPYMGYLLSAIAKTTTNIGGVITNSENKATIGSDGTFERTDFGFNALTGIVFNNGVLFNVNYGYGLTNILGANTAKINNRLLSFSLGYSFQ